MNLGLAQTEAQVYVYLAKKGSHTEEDLAKALRISVKHLRQSLDNLQNKGFVICAERQAIYNAVPLERVIEEIVKVKIQAAQLLEEEKEKFLST